MRVGLVSCVKKKGPDPAPAKNLYTSPYFRKMRAYVETSCDDWRILSALHVVIPPARVIAPYETTLKALGRAGQREWAHKAFEQLQIEFPGPDSVVFEVHGGREYTRDLVPLLRHAGYRVEEPIPSLPIGARMAWYDRHARTGRRHEAPVTIPQRSAVAKPPLRAASVVSEDGVSSVAAPERCARIHAALAALPSFREPSRYLPSDGLYFFYESGEENAHDRGPRVVRVGNHPRSTGGLHNRLRNHFSGSKNASVFRKFLGGALMRSDDSGHPCLQPGPGQGHWEKQDARTCDQCRSVEARVDRLLREHFRFRCVAISDMTERNRMEEGLVTSLAACPLCRASPHWLGIHAYNPNVKESGLWNSDYVRGSLPLTEAEVRRFEALADRSR